MKKWGLLMLALLLGNTLMAQFELTEYNGFVDVKDTTKNYLVFDFSGKTQRELYNAGIADLKIKKHTSEFEFDGIRNEVITINHYIPKAVYGTYKTIFGLKAEFNMDIDFTVTLRFKDGKIRVDSPIIKSLYEQTKTIVNGQETITPHYYLINYDDYTKSNYGMDGTAIYDHKHVLREPDVKKALENFINPYVDNIINGIKDQINSEDW